MLGFIGLGTMGFHMAGHLHHAQPGQVSVWNRSSDTSQRWHQQFGGHVQSHFEQIGQDAQVVFLCVGRDEDVESICLSKGGLVDQLNAGSIVVDHTTTSAGLARRVQSALQVKGIHFIDAPVSGGEAGAKQGKLSVMAGGDSVVFEQIKPYLNAYAKQVTYMGQSGSGQLAKMVNQICIGGILQGLSEAIQFAEAESLDVDTLLSAISGGAAQSWQMDHRAKTMHQRDFDFGFSLDWMIKDLSYCLEQAASNGTDLSATQLILEQYQSLSKQQHGAKDTSALILDWDAKR